MRWHSHKQEHTLASLGTTQSTVQGLTKPSSLLKRDNCGICPEAGQNLTLQHLQRQEVKASAKLLQPNKAALWCAFWITDRSFFPRCFIRIAVLGDRNMYQVCQPHSFGTRRTLTNSGKCYVIRNYDSACHTRIFSRKKMACKTCVCTPPVSYCETLPNLQAGRVPSQHMGLDFGSQQTIYKHQMW